MGGSVTQSDVETVSDITPDSYIQIDVPMKMQLSASAV